MRIAFNARRSWMGTLLLAGACTAAHAQSKDVTSVEATEERPETNWTERIMAEEQDLRTHHVGLLRLRASYPQQVSGAWGLMRARVPASFDCRTVCDLRGPFVQLEPGLGGIQLAAGRAVIVGEKKHNERYLANVYVGFGLKGVLLRTWGDNTLRPRGQTFVGAEGEFTITSFNVSLGVLRGVARGAGDRGWVVTGGLGWGF